MDIMKRRYTVGKDKKSGLWYAHMKDYNYIPVFGSFHERKSDAMEYANMCDGLPNCVSQIEMRQQSQRMAMQEKGE